MGHKEALVNEIERAHTLVEELTAICFQQTPDKNFIK